MFIQLLPVDIPRYWDLIKYAATVVDEIQKDALPSYLNELLTALLTEKAQAWVYVTEEREVTMVAITRILYNPQFDEKYVYIQGVYAWKKLPEEAWDYCYKQVKDFAKAQGCSYIGAQSRNPRIWEIVRNLGFVESTRIFAYRLDKE